MKVFDPVKPFLDFYNLPEKGTGELWPETEQFRNKFSTDIFSTDNVIGIISSMSGLTIGNWDLRTEAIFDRKTETSSAAEEG